MARKEPKVEPKGPPPWLGTYGDMITNLMTFFVLLLTFSSKSSGEFQEFKSSLFSGPLAGLGLLNELITPSDNYRDALVERARTAASQTPTGGSRIPPRYQEELTESVGRLRELLAQGARDETLQAIVVRLPREKLVRPDGELTAEGRLLIDSIASVFDRFPYDLQFLAADPRDLDAAAACAVALHQRWAGRGWVSAGLYPRAGAGPGTIYLAIVEETALDR